MNKLIWFLCLCCLPSLVHAQDLPAYQIYTAKGKKITFKKMVRKLTKKDIVLFGELHDNPIDHWLQLKLTQELIKYREIVLGAEMFETDNQGALNSYLQGKITRLQDDPTMRLWPNYKTDYAPLVDFAKANGRPFIATNVPDQFAKLVYRSGLDALQSLSKEELSYIAPQPIPFDSELKTYKAILTMMEHHATPELVMAQALKDATMAHFILKNYQTGHLFLHFNGTYHSEQYEGILWYLKKWNQQLNYSTIATVLQPKVNKLAGESRDIADFIICVDEAMTETH
jgi:uncharacterized iron-regulated protein